MRTNGIMYWDLYWDVYGAVVMTVHGAPDTAVEQVVYRAVVMTVHGDVHESVHMDTQHPALPALPDFLADHGHSENTGAP